MTRSGYSWECPFCGRFSVLKSGENFEHSCLIFDDGNIHGKQTVAYEVFVCTNPECREYSLIVRLCDGSTVRGMSMAKEKKAWQLVPESTAKLYPEYIPAPLRQDYEEACLIVDKSPKASATLSRRCLQGMIRDFWKISKITLYDEIEALQDKLDADTWEAIDAVRQIGNIGAHFKMM